MIDLRNFRVGKATADLGHARSQLRVTFHGADGSSECRGGGTYASRTKSSWGQGGQARCISASRATNGGVPSRSPCGAAVVLPPHCLHPRIRKEVPWSGEWCRVNSIGDHRPVPPSCEPRRRPAARPAMTGERTCGAQPRGRKGATASPPHRPSHATGGAPDGGTEIMDGLFVKYSTEDGCWCVFVPGKRKPISIHHYKRHAVDEAWGICHALKAKLYVYTRDSRLHWHHSHGVRNTGPG